MRERKKQKSGGKSDREDRLSRKYHHPLDPNGVPIDPLLIFLVMRVLQNRVQWINIPLGQLSMLSYLLREQRASLTLSLATDSASVASVCIAGSPPVQSLRNESEGLFQGLMVYETSSAASHINVPCRWGLPRVWGSLQMSQLSVREDGCSLSLTRDYATHTKLSFPPWLV